MRRPFLVLWTLCLAMFIMTASTATASASQSDDLKITPATLNFGTAMVGDPVLKPVTILNRTNSWLYYAGADWPNLQHPGVPYPYGIWNRSFEPFPCWDIAPRSSCTLTFGFVAPEPGPFSSEFRMWYVSDVSTMYYSNTVYMRGTGA